MLEKFASAVPQSQGKDAKKAPAAAAKGGKNA
jgi:hypothetical protein